VGSRNEVVRIDFEDSGNFRPGLAGDLIGRSPFQGLQVLGEVVGGDEGQDMGLVASLIVRFIRSAWPLSGMRSSAPRCPAVSGREPAIW
jgi:hypothetical protein